MSENLKTIEELREKWGTSEKSHPQQLSPSDYFLRCDADIMMHLKNVLYDLQDIDCLKELFKQICEELGDDDEDDD